MWIKSGLLDKEIGALIDAAWDGYDHSRKSPRTQKAGEGYADPDYDLAIDWIRGRDAIDDAQRRHDDASEHKRILLINGSSRSDQACPGEMSKTFRSCKIAEPIFVERRLYRHPPKSIVGKALFTMTGRVMGGPGSTVSITE